MESSTVPAFDVGADDSWGSPAQSPNPKPFVPNPDAAPFTPASSVPPSQSPSQDRPRNEQRAPRRSPYINPDRYLTGGNAREKLTAEQLEEKMARMKAQNAELLKRKQETDADEESYAVSRAEIEKQKEAEAEERRRKEEKRKLLQASIDDERQKSLARKMAALSTREWDSEKRDEDWNFDGPDHRPAQGSDNAENTPANGDHHHAIEASVNGNAETLAKTSEDSKLATASETGQGTTQNIPHKTAQVEEQTDKSTGWGDDAPSTSNQVSADDSGW